MEPGWRGKACAILTSLHLASVILIIVKYFSRSRSIIIPLLFESVVVLAVVEMWETLRRFPRTVGSDLCFPSVRHFHGCLELLTILLSPFWPVRLDSSGY